MADALTSGPLMMATREMGFMFVWYGLLWSVLEAIGERKLDIRGPFLEDINQMTDLLRRCRNGVMHVPPKGRLLDRRIDEIVKEPESPDVIRRIHRGIGRLFVEEFKRLSNDNEGLRHNARAQHQRRSPAPHEPRRPAKRPFEASVT